MNSLDATFQGMWTVAFLLMFFLIVTTKMSIKEIKGFAVGRSHFFSQYGGREKKLAVKLLQMLLVKSRPFSVTCGLLCLLKTSCPAFCFCKCWGWCQNPLYHFKAINWIVTHWRGTRRRSPMEGVNSVINFYLWLFYCVFFLVSVDQCCGFSFLFGEFKFLLMLSIN